MKTTKQQKALLSAADDAAYILEPLLTKQVPAGQVAVAVERVLRISLADAGLPVSQRDGVSLRGTTVEAEAQRITQKLLAPHAVRGKLAA